MEDIELSILEWANRSGDLDRIQYVFSDDNSNELIGRLSVNGLDNKGDESFNGLKDQSDIISSLTSLSEDLLHKVIIKGVNNITNIVMNEIKSSEYINRKIAGQIKIEFIRQSYEFIFE